MSKPGHAPYRIVGAAAPARGPPWPTTAPPTGESSRGALRARPVLFQPPMPASASAASEYEPRTPEASILYRVVEAHLERFLARTAGEEGRPGLPGFVPQEFEAYLRCGILAHGFAGPARVHSCSSGSRC